MTLNAKNRSEKGFKMHKSLQIWGWFLPKKIDLPTQGGGRSGNFRGSKNQKSGKCHELSRKSIIFFPIPPRGFQGGGQNFKSPVNFMNCRENRSGNFRGSKNQKSGKCHELSRKSIQFVFTHPNAGGGVPGGGLGVQISKVR